MSDDNILITSFFKSIGAPQPSEPPFTPPTSGQGDSQAPAEGATPTSTANANSPVLSIGAYLDAVELPKLELEQLLNSDLTADLLRKKLYWAEIIARAGSLDEFKNKLKGQLGEELKLYDKEQREILKYNEGDRVDYNDHIDDVIDPKISSAEDAQETFHDEMEEAQETYDDGLPYDSQAEQDAALAQLEQDQDAARTKYNTFAQQWNIDRTQLNSDLDAKYQAYLADVNTLNTQIDANNEKIEKLNEQRKELGITESIPLQDNIVPLPPPEPLPELDVVPPNSTNLNDAEFADYDHAPAVDPNVGLSTEIAITPRNNAEENFFENLSEDADDLNSGSIRAYNDAINDSDEQVQIMRQAIDDFNNGVIDAAAYNQIRTTYLLYAQTKNSQLAGVIDDVRDDLQDYNDGIGAKNAQIKVFNEQRADDDLPLIPDQSPVTIPTEDAMLLPTDIPEAPESGQPPLDASANDFPAIMSFVTDISPGGSATSTDMDSYIDAYYTPAADVVTAAVGTDLAKLILDQAYADFLNYYLAGYSILAPNGAYIKPIPDVFFEASSSGAGSPVTMSSVTVGLDNPALEGIISNSLIEAARALLNLPIPPTVAAKILSFGTLALLDLSTRSGLLASGLLGSAGSIQPGGAAAGVTISLALLNQIGKLVDSGVISTAIHSYLVQSGLSETEIAQIEGILTAGVTLGLLQFAILQTAIALGLPGLIPQVLGTLYGIEDLSSLIASLSGFGLNDVIDNAYFLGQLKFTLTDLGLADQTTVINAINNVAAGGPFESDLDFKNALIREFIAAGVGPANALALANAAVNFTRSERLIRDLDAQFVKSNILDAAQKFDSSIMDIITRVAEKQDYKTRREFQRELIKELVKEGYKLEDAIEYSNQLFLATQTEALRTAFNSDRVDQEELRVSLRQKLIDQGISADEAETAVVAALSGVSANAYTSELLYREGLEEALRNAGITDRIAARVASGASVAQIGTNPLETQSPTALSRDELAAQLTDAIANKLKDEVGNDQALIIANLYVTALLGNGDEAMDVTSVLGRMQSANNYVKEHFGDKAGEVLAEVFTEFIKPSYDLFDLSYRFMDPANILVLAAAWGVMYNGTENQSNLPIDYALKMGPV